MSILPLFIIISIPIILIFIELSHLSPQLHLQIFCYESTIFFSRLIIVTMVRLLCYFFLFCQYIFIILELLSISSVVLFHATFLEFILWTISNMFSILTQNLEIASLDFFAFHHIFYYVIALFFVFVFLFSFLILSLFFIELLEPPPILITRFEDFSTCNELRS